MDWPVQDSGGYGPCHWCGSETPERHGEILFGCCQSSINPDRLLTVEVCQQCLDAFRTDPSSVRCPDEDAAADPSAKAIEICQSAPMRGVWHN